MANRGQQIAHGDADGFHPHRACARPGEPRQPAFPDVDKFVSRENLANKVRSKLVPAEWLTNYWKGKVDQDRDYFWYRQTQTSDARPTEVQDCH